MSKLFDASAIILLTKNHPHEAPELLKHEHLLDLTLYEIGNTIWKINKLYKKPDKNTALESIEQAYHLTSLMNIHAIGNRQMYLSIMENALDLSDPELESLGSSLFRGGIVRLVAEGRQRT